MYHPFNWSTAVALIVLLGINGDAEDPLFHCLSDPDYDELLAITKHGLPPTQTPRHVAVIGAGVAGLTAAKFLEDAGHKVSSFLQLTPHE